MLGLRTYRGRLSFLPVGEYRPRALPGRSSTASQGRNRSGSLSNQATPDMDPGIYGNYRSLHTSLSCPEGMLNTSPSDQNLTGLQRVDSFSNGEPKDGHVGLVNGCVNGDTVTQNGCGDRRTPDVIETPLLVPLNQPVPQNWVTIEDDFVSMFAAFLTHLGPDLYVALDKKWADGQMILTFVRAGVPRAAMLGIFMSMEDGSAANSPYVEQIPVHAFRLEPLTDRGVIAVDGEKVDYGPIQAQVLGPVARVLVRPQTHTNSYQNNAYTS